MSTSSSRRKVLTVAGVVAAGGIAAGGVLAATGADATSGSSGSGSSGSASSSAARPPAPGNPAYDADGTVTSVSSSSLTVRSEFGKSSTYALSSSTKVHSGPDTSASRSDIDTGDRVHVRGSKTSSGVRATDVDIHMPHIDGSVTGVSSGTITVTDHDGFTRTIDLSSSTKYKIDGKSTSSSAVRSGRVVHASGTVDSDGTTLDATVVEVVTKAPTPPKGGPGSGPAGGPPAPGNAPKNAPKAPSGKTSSGSSGRSSGSTSGSTSGGSTGGSSSAPSSQPSSGSGSAS